MKLLTKTGTAKSIKYILLAASISLTLLATTFVQAGDKPLETETMSKQQETRSESVSGVSYDGEHLVFSVISNGCTSPKHFEISHVVEAQQCQITITRTQQDFCRKVPQAVEIVLPWSRPEGTEDMELIVKNPLLERSNTKASSNQSAVNSKDPADNTLKK